MQHNFDEIVNRQGTDSIKWKAFPADILPMWVADADFKSPAPMLEALEERVRHGVFGYMMSDQTVREAAAHWLTSRHNWPVTPDQVAFSPSVEHTLTQMAEVFTAPGENILFLTPAYPPFFTTTKNKGRNVVGSPLRLVKGADGAYNYQVDYDDLEAKMALPATRLLILCNPHNPTGRAWSREELLKIGELCEKHNILVVADEIHSDFVFGKAHLPFATLSPELARRTLTAISPSKTFNTAALQTSAVVSLNPHLLARFRSAVSKAALDPPVLGALAMQVAYTRCGYYADQAAVYIRANQEFAVKFINDEVPGLAAYLPEATYLLWLDCRALMQKLALPADAAGQAGLMEFFLNKAKVALNSGIDYGGDAIGFVRLNAACPRVMLLDGLNRLKNATVAVN